MGTNAIGIISKSGKSGGTYAHPDIAFEFKNNHIYRQIFPNSFLKFIVKKIVYDNIMSY